MKYGRLPKLPLGERVLTWTQSRITKANHEPASFEGHIILIYILHLSSHLFGST